MKNTTEIPKFRYLEDVRKFLNQLGRELDESSQVLVQQQKTLGASLLAAKPSVLKAIVFDVTPTDNARQREQLKTVRTKIDPALTKVVVPNIKKLQSQYNLAEDLYEKYRTVEQVETTLTMSFATRKGDQYARTMAEVQALKTKIQDQLKLCFAFLNEVAAKHVPQQFMDYVDALAALIEDHVIFKSYQSFLYVSVDPEGDLVFTNYLMLEQVANDEGSIAPHLYVSVQWVLAKVSTISVDLNYEYEVPNKLIGSGELVGSVGDAAKAVATMLELENFSSALGVVPLALQLKVDPTSLDPSMFSYQDFISKVIVEENTISFKLRREASSSETVTEIGAQLYKELKVLMKPKGVRLTMKQTKIAGVYVLIFVIVKVSEGGEFNQYDMEFMRDKFGLNTQALRKIVQIINRSDSKRGLE